jgi:hypothetical protein
MYIEALAAFRRLKNTFRLLQERIMLRKLLAVGIATLALAPFSSRAWAQDTNIPLTSLPPDQMPGWLRPQYMPLHAASRQIPKRPGLYSPADWKTVIDAYWGPGLPGGTKSSLFVQWWNLVQGYSCAFHNSDTTLWDSVWAQYNPGVVDYSTVSEGWFAAILGNAGYGQRDIHLEATDFNVAYTFPSPGAPIMYRGACGDVQHFGAACTALDDSTVVVYDAVSPHPLGLEPGDLVLGYDGIPWKDLYPQLLEANLPSGQYNGMLWGGNGSSVTHNLLSSVGNNWHLFDSIDVVKYGTDDTLRLSTAPLASLFQSLWASEQLPIPGIPRPSFSTVPITYGVVPGTNIGYIYDLWVPDAGARTLFR